MSKLQERFLAEGGKTLVKSNDKNAPLLASVLKKAIKKGNFALRGGLPTNHFFYFDAIY